MTFEVRQGDCVEAMAAMPAGSVDAVVCDPPYGLEFMGREWDRLTYAGGNPALKASDRPIAERDGESWQPGSTYGGRQKNPRCRRCGAFKFQRESGRCKCPQPDWDTRHAETGFQMQAWHEVWSREAFRVLKPGGHLLAFGGTRTYHRLVCAVEDAGFEIRDTIAYMYGSGFPKSLNVGKAIDRAAGAEREGLGLVKGAASQNTEALGPYAPEYEASAPATPEAERWEGWGTALKPSHEPVVVARKPLSGTVAATVLEHGTGALNIDSCRVEGASGDGNWAGAAENGYGATHTVYNDPKGEQRTEPNAAGRWPANVVLDEEAAGLLDEQTGDIKSPAPYTRSAAVGNNIYGVGMGNKPEGAAQDGYGDTGGASRFFATFPQTPELCPGCTPTGVDGRRPCTVCFGWRKVEDDEPETRFRYVAKASRGERNAGLEGFEEVGTHEGGRVDGEGGMGTWDRKSANHHPTVKPISLMRWLVRLVTPPGGTVLDPFCGSGSTGCAAVLEGFDFIGLEREAEYVAIAQARIAWWLKHRGDGEASEILAAGEARDEVEATGQGSLFDEAA